MATPQSNNPQVPDGPAAIESRASAEALLAAIVQSSDDAIISKGLDGIITSWNMSAERLFGYTADEAIGKPISILFPPDRLDEEPKIIERLKRGERVDHFETIRVRKDGTQLEISLTISPLKDASGRVVGASKIARDITELKRVRAELKKAKEIFETANKAKDQFLAALSHELRTPLTPVLIAAAAMEMNPLLPDSIRHEVAMIRRNVELETRLIDDLLDLSGVIAGKLNLNLEAVEVHEALHHVCDTCRPLILEKAIHLHCPQRDTNLYVKADSARLQQILWNLLRNAAKFTPKGGDIYLGVSHIEGNRVRIQVRDTGIGIPPEVLPRLFNAFEQGDAKITRQFGGMGLGLAISKALTGMHHGTLRAESAGPNTGATFTLEFPLVSPPALSHSTSIKPHGVSEAGLRLLVVDDHADTALMLSKLLSACGHKVHTAGNAADALDLCSREHFDVVVSDIGLPDVTGYELMHQIKARHSMKGIAMSGYGLEDDVRKSREAGFDAHIVKPTTIALLDHTIRSLAGQSK